MQQAEDIFDDADPQAFADSGQALMLFYDDGTDGSFSARVIGRNNQLVTMIAEWAIKDKHSLNALEYAVKCAREHVEAKENKKQQPQPAEGKEADND